MKKNKMIYRRIVILTAWCILLLSGCSLFSSKPAQKTYVLSALPTSIPTKKTRAINLMVMTPETTAAYQTTQMAYNIKPYEIAYFSLNRWVEPPAQMLQPLIVQTLQNTHHFHAIVTAPFMGHYQYALNTEILKLQQNFLYSPIQYELKLRIQLINMKTNQVIGTREISICEPVPQATPYGGVIAANCATAQALKLIAAFCLEKIR